MRKFPDGELRRRVDEVLFYVWDPIGVSPEPCARGEYEDYVPKLLQLVIDNTNIVPISKCLAEIARGPMGGPANLEKCDEVAELLLRHKRAIEDGLA